MGRVEIIAVAVVLAMDAFAVAILNGILLKKRKISIAVRFGIAFGLFQFAMPLIGWLLGQAFLRYLEAVDHFIAFGLLTVIGVRMIFESFKSEELREQRLDKILSIKNLVLLAIATSIDALAVGITLAVTNANIWIASSIIGVVAFVISTIGYFIGVLSGGFFKKGAEIFGGCVLIGIGIKILLEHMLAQ